MKTFQLLFKSLAGTLTFLFILFLSAGRMDYWQGWLYAALNILLAFINSVAAMKKDLSEERGNVKEGAKSWDKRIVGLSALVLVFTYITAGLDAGRFHWSTGFHWGTNIAGVLLIITGEIFFLLAQKENKFFSSLMRIQADRGHSVCDKGIYRVVRHPAYTGSIITAIGIPLVLNSAWSYIPSTIAVMLMIARTDLEDTTLIKELEGYEEYTSRTRYRLIPFIW